jgi:cAMP-binding proteins - catabolite gene activator and regulatory subunit of cAMP-dependent protein kinases
MQPIVELLAEVPLFEDFDPEELQSVARLCKKKTFPKGAILFLEGDVGDKLYLIQSGLVKISRQEQNREITLALFRDGDFFGEMSLIEKNSLRSATAETIEPSVLYVLLRQDFIHFLENSPKLCLRLLEIAYSRLRKANDQIHDLTFLDVRGRIAKNLVRLADEYGVPGPAGTQIDIKLTHQQIANMSGTVRETVTKTLHELQEEGVIDIDKKKIRILDPRRLQELIRY